MGTHEYRDSVCARHADRQAETGSERERSRRRNEPERWDEDEASLAAHSAAAVQRKIDFLFLNIILNEKLVFHLKCILL